VSRRITVGVPVYNGTEHVVGALKCLQEQTFREFEVIVSVDGNDQATANACRPFLADDRFRMVVHPERLDWFGNFNWLLQQPLCEFFCYRQHDDTTAPEFFEVLLRTADARPNAAAIYADCQWTGGRSDVEIAPSIEGETLDRLRQHIEQKHPVAVRGLIRREATQQAGPIRSDEFRGLSEIFVWLAKVLRWGSFIRVPEALYYRLDHPENYHKQWFDWPEERKRASWTTLFTGLLEATMPICTTPEERLFFQQFILDRVVVVRPGQTYHYTPTSPHDSGALIADCLERLAREGNMRLLRVDEIPEILQTSARVQAPRAVTTDRDRLSSELSAVTRDRDRLSSELTAMTADRNRLFSEVSATARDRDRLLSQLDGLSSELSAMTADRNRLSSETQRLHDQLSAIATDRDRLFSELNAMTVDRNRLSLEIQPLQAKLSAMMTDRDRLSSDAQRLQAELVAINQSTSWRITGPLRRSAEFVRSIRRLIASA
jgi:regulator of replication initiation timing/GT2 family glycosyltransferase